LEISNRRLNDIRLDEGKVLTDDSRSKVVTSSEDRVVVLVTALNS
jgi:hypothetical protein